MSDIEKIVKSDIENIVEILLKEHRERYNEPEDEDESEDWYNDDIETISKNLSKFIIENFLENKKEKVHSINEIEEKEKEKKEKEKEKIKKNEEIVAKFFLKESGAEDGIIMENNGKTYFIKIASSKDEMSGLEQKLEEQKIFNFLDKEISIKPNIYIIKDDKIYKDGNIKYNEIDSTTNSFVIFVSEKSFLKTINFNDIRSEHYNNYNDNDNKNNIFEKISKNLLKIIFPTIILGIEDVRFHNCSFEMDEKNNLTGNLKLIDILTDKSDGDDKHKYGNLFNVKDAKITKRIGNDFQIFSVLNQKFSFFGNLINIFEYTQSIKGNNDNFCSTFTDATSVEFLNKIFKYCDENQEKIKNFIVNQCLKPFFENLKKSDFEENNKKTFFERFFFLDEILDNELLTRIKYNNSNLFKEIMTHKSKEEQILLNKKIKKKFVAEYNKSWVEYINERQKQEYTTEQSLLK